MAEPLAAKLAELDPANAAYYVERQKAFAEKFGAAIVDWEKQGASLRGVPIVVQHKAFMYLIAWLGLTEVVSLEPKPGVEPTTAYLSQVLEIVKQKQPRMVIRASYQSDRASQWMAERAKIPAVVLPSTIGGDDEAKTLYSFYDDIVARLRKGMSP